MERQNSIFDEVARSVQADAGVDRLAKAALASPRDGLRRSRENDGSLSRQNSLENRESRFAPRRENSLTGVVEEDEPASSPPQMPVRHSAPQMPVRQNSLEHRSSSRQNSLSGVQEEQDDGAASPYNAPSRQSSVESGSRPSLGSSRPSAPRDYAPTEVDALLAADGTTLEREASNARQDSGGSLGHVDLDEASRILDLPPGQGL